jgi:hypothetical protein
MQGLSYIVLATLLVNVGMVYSIQIAPILFNGYSDKGFKEVETNLITPKGCCAPVQWESRFNIFLKEGGVQRGSIVMDIQNNKSFTYVHQKLKSGKLYDEGEWFFANEVNCPFTV